MEATFIYPERKLWAAMRDALIWLSGPVSERGATRGSRMALHMGGPMVHERRLAMREHPVGRRLLDERPDLCAALNDMGPLPHYPMSADADIRGQVEKLAGEGAEVDILMGALAV